MNKKICQAAVVAGTIAREIAMVNTAADDITESSANVNANSLDFLCVANELKKAVGTFKIKSVSTNRT